MVTGRVAERSVSRRRLFADLDLNLVGSRHDLVALAQSGYAGLRLPGWTDPAAMSDRERVALVALLRDARGVALRVSWSGSVESLDVARLCHLDPPRQRDGSFGWPPPTVQSLNVRRGPRFLSVDDTRRAPRRIEVDRREPVGIILDDLAWSRLISDHEAESVKTYDAEHFVFRSGQYAVGVAVRQGVWCV